jgi:branched-chain amino acid transport system ATP-binding protein
MSDVVISLEQVTAGYGDAPALRCLDLTVGRSEMVGLLGSNGAGKSTTLRAISGTRARLMSGQITFNGEDLRKLTPPERARRGIAHVPDGRGLFFGLTVAEHFRLRPRGEKIDEATAYDLFPALKELRGRRAGLLSGGEQQMLAIGRALARHPRLLLLDELSLGLAPVIVERILPVVRQYASESGCGVVLVEQHAHLALEVIDRGYVLAHGEVVMHKPAAELLADPHLMVSSYLGEHE